MADTQSIAQPAPQTPAWDPGAPENAWYKWRAFWAVGLSLVTMVMSFSIVFLALPAIAEDFGVTFKEASLLVIAQSLTVSAFMVPLGKVADMIGRKKFHLIGMVLFGGGAIACAFATNLPFLIVTRVIMSLGSSMGQAVSTAITTSVFPANERGKALGSQTTAVAIGGASGTIVSGVTLQFLPWQALFIFMAIPTAIAFLWGLYILKDERIGSFSGEERPPYDWLGAILSAVATAIIILTITNPFALAWGSPVIIAGAFTGIATVIVFIWWQLKTPHPMVDLRLFKITVFKFSILTRYLRIHALIRNHVPNANFPRRFPRLARNLRSRRYAAVGHRHGHRSTSLRQTLRPLRRPTIHGRRIRRPDLHRHRPSHLFSTTTPLYYIAVVTLINGLAQGAWSAPNASATMGSVPRSSYGLVSAIINLTRNLGNVTGQAVVTAIIAGIMIARGYNVPLAELGETPQAGQAFLDGWKYAYLFATGIVALALVTSFLTKPSKTEISRS